MKLTLLCNGYDIVNRGAEQYTKEIYKLLKNEYDITILSAKDTHTKTRKDLRIPWRNGRAYLEAQKFGKELYRNFEEHIKGTDVILNNTGFVGSYWCKKIRKRYGIPFIAFERGGGKEERINNLFKPDLISYLTKYSYDRSKYKKKIHLPIGIDTSYKKTPVPKFIKEMKRPIVLSPSALVGFKRVDLNIKAFGGIDGTLVQTSDGNQNYVHLGREKLGEKFVYTGRIKKDMLNTLFEHADLVINASLHEAFGIVYLEAMKYNTPIVTENDARRREIVAEAGIFCNCHKVLEYANAIRSALKREWNNIPVKRARKFDWKNLKPKYIEAIESLNT